MANMKDAMSKQAREFNDAALKVKGATPEWTKAEKFKITQEARKASRHHI